MASLLFDFREIGRRFINLEHGPDQPAVLAVFLGGSNLYTAKENPDDCADWYGAIIVRTKLDIFDLVNQRRLGLMAILGIVREEMPEFRVPDPSSPISPQYDAIRFAGYTRTQSKRSVKVLSLDYFSEFKTSLDILSHKDKRIYETDSPSATANTRLYRVYPTPTTVCVHGQEASFAAFGVTADLLVSGACLFGQIPYGRQIKNVILSHYSAVTKRHATTQSFARYTRFSAVYIDWLTRELSEMNLLNRLRSPGPSCSCSFRQGSFLYGKANTAHGIFSWDFSGQNKCISLKSFQLFEQGASSRSQRLHSVFMSNSSTYEVTTSSKNDIAAKMFCKRSQYQEQEVQGTVLAAAFYPHIQLPCIISSGELLYPFFEGTTESELRLSYIQSGRRNWHSAEMLLYTEMVKAEDILRAYRTCMTRTEEYEGKPAENTIQRFFHSRLIENARFREFYGNGFRAMGRPISMAKLLEMPWKVNGVAYPSLNELFRTALDVLHPSSTQNLSCLIVFGLGDAHGANVMISSNLSSDSSREIMYVDYEVAGFHPVMFDLAKPLYNDVFFETLYKDILPEVLENIYKLEEDCINVNFTPYIDDITQVIFDIKRWYLLQPLFNIILRFGGNLERNVPLLSNALLLCATLTRNYSMADAAFFQNVATGIILSSATDWEEFYSCFRTLGVSS